MHVKRDLHAGKVLELHFEHVVVKEIGAVDLPEGGTEAVGSVTALDQIHVVKSVGDRVDRVGHLRKLCVLLVVVREALRLDCKRLLMTLSSFCDC